MRRTAAIAAALACGELCRARRGGHDGTLVSLPAGSDELRFSELR